MAENQSAQLSSVSSRGSASVRSRAMGRIPMTLEALNSFSTQDRKNALAEAVNSFDQGIIVRPQETGWVNVLARTFFSHSVDGSSPARLAWEAVIRGLSVIGCADRDNLGALGEMLAAGDALGVRATVSLETKTHVLSYADRELNCPGQPGFLRALGVGFTSVPPLDSEHGRLIASLPNRARDRNTAMIDKLNSLLAPVSVDYETDVLPLTPAGNATEVHISAAYAAKAKTIFPGFHDQAVFWADVLGRSPNDAECLLGDDRAFMEALSDKLMRIGDSESHQPKIDAYPKITEFFQAVKASGAVPCLLWRDGESEGESNPAKLLDDAMNWGARAVALTPDRNWNIADREEKERKLAALARMAEEARKRHLPMLVGSPMSGLGQKFVDSFDAPEIAAYFRDFTDSAFWLYGHATLERAAGLGLASAWSKTAFGRDPAKANAFYIEVGKKAAPGKATRVRIAALGSEPDPQDVLDALAPLRL